MGRRRTDSPSSLGPPRPQQRALRSRRREAVRSGEDQTKRNPTTDALPPCAPQPAPPEPTRGPAPEVMAPTSGGAAGAGAEPAMDGAVREGDGEPSGLTSGLNTAALSDHTPDDGEDSVEVEERRWTSPSAPPTDQREVLTGAGAQGEAEGFRTLCPTTGQMEEEEEDHHHQRSAPVCSAEDWGPSGEPVGGTLSRKRKRMGTCVLTEKERSHKLQREAEEKRVGERGRSVALEADPEEESHSVAEEGKLVLNSPVTQVIKVGPPTEQSGPEKEPAPPTGGAGDSSSVAACGEGSDAWSPTAPPPVRSEDSDHLARASKDCEGRGPSGDRDVRLPTEIAGGKDEPEKAERAKEDVAEPRHAPTQLTSSGQVVPTESRNRHREEEPTPQQPTDGSARTAGPSETQGSQPSHSFTDTGLGRSETIGTQPGTAAAAPSGAAEEEGNSRPLEEADSAASPAPQHLPASATTDLSGFGSFDYISDSQLHDISLMEAQGGSSHCLEDASARVGGLVRELSYLNRIVMATQRKVETLRRGNRGPKAH